MGAAIHADDLHTSAASMDCVYQQDNVIISFSSDTCLKLNTSKCEIVRISPPTQEQSVLQVGVSHISTSEAIKCLGVFGGIQAYQQNTPSLRIYARPEELSLLLADSVPFRVI